MFGNTSMFGYQSDNPIDRAAYDLMVLKDIDLLDEDKGDEEED